MQEHLQHHAQDAEECRICRGRTAHHQPERLTHRGDIGADVEAVGQQQQEHQRQLQPARVVATDVVRETPAGGAADARADQLDGRHQRPGQHGGPQQAVAEGGAGLRVGGDAARIVVGGAGDQAGTEVTQPRLPARAACLRRRSPACSAHERSRCAPAAGVYSGRTAMMATALYHGPICAILQDRSKKEKKILLPRGWYKTTVGTIGYPLWEAINVEYWNALGYDLSILLTQNTSTNARSKLKSIRAQIEKNVLLRRLFPHLIPSSESVWTADSLSINKTGQSISDSPEGTFRCCLVSRHRLCLVTII